VTAVTIKHRSLSRRLTALVVMVSGGVTAFIIALEMMFLYQDESTSMMRSMKSAAVTASPLMTEALWNDNHEAMRKIAEGVASNAGVLTVTVKDYKNVAKYVLNIKTDDAVQSTAMVETPLAYTSSLNKLQKLGALEVVYSQDAALAKVTTVLLRTILLNSVKTLLVAAILMFLFGQIIIKPIESLVKYFRENKADTPQPDKVTNRKSILKPDSAPKDELDEMIAAILNREILLADYVSKSKKTVATQKQAINLGKKTIDSQSAKIAEAEEKILLERARAEAATRLAQLGEMAGGIAHEINNPLTIIMGYQFTIRTQIKKSSPELEKIETLLGKTEAMIMRISNIIKGLRDFARDGANDPYVPTDVNKILENTAMLTEFRMKHSNIELRVSKPEETFSLDCRSIQLEQVLVNVINNAHDAVADLPGDKWVELKVFSENDQCVFWITDSGSGIPEEVVKKIFTPFFTTKEIGKGTGLGLSIGFGIIHAHHGTMSVDAKCPNTRFVISIPLRYLSEKDNTAPPDKSVA
jgi:C4-dicarboxylate-specific signal transduction histidine kinase